MDKLNDIDFEISSPHDSFTSMIEKLNTIFNELCTENDTLRNFIRENGLDNEFRLYQRDLPEINPGDIIIIEEKIPEKDEKEQQNIVNKDKDDPFMDGYESLLWNEKRISIEDFEHKDYGRIQEKRADYDIYEDGISISNNGSFKTGDTIIYDPSSIEEIVEKYGYDFRSLMPFPKIAKVVDILESRTSEGYYAISYDQRLKIEFLDGQIEETIYDKCFAANKINLEKYEFHESMIRKHIAASIEGAIMVSNFTFGNTEGLSEREKLEIEWEKLEKQNQIIGTIEEKISTEEGIKWIRDTLDDIKLSTPELKDVIAKIEEEISSLNITLFKEITLETNVEQQVEGEQKENKQPKNTLQNDRKNVKKGGR